MHLRASLLFCGCILAAASRGADVVRISSEGEFSSFVKNVNSGASYSGTTVLLASDLSLPEVTEPIGKDYFNYFRGVFDGQGHTISDLQMNTSSNYAGLFGYSQGLFIKNVVLDSSCSVLSSYDDYYGVYIGGIIGECKTANGKCNIENSVNMADVTFKMHIYYRLYFGGIIGHIESSDYDSYVKNCANYGSVTHSGSISESYVGGIVGELEGSHYTYVQNCLNYGTITHSGTSDNQLYLGGIIGYSKYTYIENCVSAGKVSTSTTPSKSYIGSIIGHVYSNTHLYYCYYTSDLSGYERYGDGTPLVASHVLAYDSATFKLDGSVSIGNYTGDSLAGALNAATDYYYVLDYYSNWVINKDSKTVAFTVNGRTSPTAMNYKVILLPELTNEDKMWFDGWYTDSGCTKPIESFEITADTELYGKYEENTNSYTVSFDTRGGSHVAPITAQFWDEVELPKETTKNDCTISSWETIYGDNAGFSLTMPAHNITLYAVWKCTRIATPDDFISFSKVVNSGDSYSGTTVFLASDLSFSGKTLGPAGKDRTVSFLGVFDGQGHTISDLKISSSSAYTGLFGYSKGLTIKNVVLDSSCSITNSYNNSDDVHVGSIVGYCESYYGECRIENSVNMADITFVEKNAFNYRLYLGGIIGQFYPPKYDSYVKNCANYGSVTHSGTSSTAFIGGILGDLSGSDSYYTYIQNCLNYGAIIHDGTSSEFFYLGGIIGYSKHTYIENCVSAGSISASTTPSKSYIGSIIGRISSGTYVYYCYCTSDLSGYERYGDGTPLVASHVLAYDSTTFKLDGSVSIGSYTGDSLAGALNAATDYYYVLDYYSNWVINKNSKTVAFTVNGRTSPTAMSYKIILLPELTNEDKMWFDGWYTDSGCTKPIESFEIIADTELYGKYEENINSYTISFDTRGGSHVAPITAQFWDEVELPDDVTKNYCTISYWETIYGDNAGFSLTMPAHNITLYAVWKCTRIATPDDFISFSKVVNSGDSYSGTTVLLASDLSFSGKALGPAGKDSYNYFLGVFDGQGHTISDLKISSSSAYTGLFGYSKGSIIKNVVLDSSCSVLSLYGDTNHVGGIIGYCESRYGECRVENSVNMADVMFTGKISSGYLYLGGVIGYMSSSKYDSYVRNCANYGSVTHSGTSSTAFIGGTVGNLYGSSSYYAYIQNCLNYGAISSNGTLHKSYLGGITGKSEYAYIENCVSAGKVSTIKSNSAGNVVGYIKYDTYVYYCYYTSDTGLSELYGDGVPVNTTGSPDSPSTVNSTLVSKLNEYAAGQSWNKWLLNKNNASVTFIINHGKGFAENSQVVLLPDLADGDEVPFSGWFSDAELTSPFNSSEVESPTTLYGVLCESNYTVTLDVNGGDASSIPSHKKAVICDGIYRGLPTPTRAGYTFAGWFTEKEGGERVESGSKVTRLRDHSLYAHWTPRKYTVTLNANGGDVPSVKEVSVTFNSTYGDLPTATREGYVFLGWFTEDNESVTSETVVSIPSDHTLYAHWTINNFTLTFDFDNGAAPDVRTLKFGDPIAYPPNPTKEGCSFAGWDKSVSQMPASDLTITALWRELPDERNAWYSASPSLAVAAMIAILDFVIILAAVAFIIMFLFYARRRRW